jgi:hypothetical protein
MVSYSIDDILKTLAEVMQDEANPLVFSYVADIDQEQAREIHSWLTESNAMSVVLHGDASAFEKEHNIVVLDFQTMPALAALFKLRFI